MKIPVNLFWFRRDLRLTDNAALYHALKPKLPVVPVFIFDTNILNDLSDKADARVAFIHHAITSLREQLAAMHVALEVIHDTPENAFRLLLHKYDVKNVFTNRDYEQYAIDRDQTIHQLLQQHGAALHTFKDQVIFEAGEVLKSNGEPYTVFTPYSRQWKAKLNAFYLSSYPTEEYFTNFHQQQPLELPTLEALGFQKKEIDFPAAITDEALISRYQQQRDFPAANGTSRLGIHLRFGTISIRQLARFAQTVSETFLNELIWRDFYHMILASFEHVRKGASFNKKYDRIQWINDEKQFAAWCESKTGYPIVDAGMRELNATGFMHNRVRMIVASFLTKHLLIDWRWGEAYFAKKLLDYDYAANNGGWQWAAGSGCDAAPYFRVFNPTLQTQKFDKDLVYIKKWVPELNSFNYPKPIVDHDMARKRALEVYKSALG